MDDHTTNESTNEIEPGYCRCGCGQKTNLAPHSNRKIGWVKGQPIDFVHGHNQRSPEPVEKGDGLCACGCGETTPIARCSDKSKGWVKGRHVRFVVGHGNRKPVAESGPNPGGLCMCGCGKATKIAKSTKTECGWVKGHPIPYIYGHQARQPLAERFYSKVDKSNPDGCWEWIGCKSRGYGRFRVGRTNKGAHRVAWELENGPIPDGMSVLHHCDNPSCVRVLHLFLGSQADNNADRSAKGRTVAPEGSASPNAAFTDDQVRNLRNQFDSMNVTIKQFAVLHNVKYETMLRLIKGQTYKNA